MLPLLATVTGPVPVALLAELVVVEVELVVAEVELVVAMVELVVAAAVAELVGCWLCLRR